MPRDPRYTEAVISIAKTLRELNPADKDLLGTLIAASSVGLVISGYGLYKFIPKAFM